MINDQIIGETGIVNNIDHNSQTIFLKNSYDNPVIFAQPLSYNSPQAAIVRIEDIQSDRFTAFVQETSNLGGWHPKESFSYLVLEQGTWQLEDDTLLEVGTVKSDLLGNEGWENVSFAQNFADDPLVFSQVQTNNGSDFVLTRQRNTSTSGFQLTMQEEEALMDGHTYETLGWLAISAGNGNWSDKNYQAGTTGDNVTDDWHTINFGNDFSQSPIFLASIASYDGIDPSGLRSSNLNSNQVDIKIKEDTSKDSETAHTTEVVNFLALDGSGVLKAKGEEAEQSPYGGKPWEIKDGARIEAEHFDIGGQDISYSDADSRNRGNAYRITEGIDIETTRDAGGGYNVGWIPNGEWLEYTTNVTGGNYDIKIRVASNSSVTGDVLLKLGDQVLGRFDVKNTGGWQNWETLTIKGVDIPDGNNQILRLEAEGGNFNVNWLEFEEVAPSQELPTESQEIPPTKTGNGTLLFKSGFEGSTRIVPYQYFNQNVHTIVGSDGDFSWETDLPSDVKDPRFFYLAGEDPDLWVDTKIDNLVGPDGNSTNALYMGVKDDYPGNREGNRTRNEFWLHPSSDFKQAYMSYWMKVPENLLEVWPDVDHSRLNIMSWKDDFAPSGSENFVFGIDMARGANDEIYWRTRGNEFYPKTKNVWSSNYQNHLVPLGEWFKLEVFFRQGDDNDGRLWFAVNGQEIGDYRGQTQHATNPQDLRFWAPFKVYPNKYGGPNVGIHYDDLEIWSDFPDPSER